MSRPSDGINSPSLLDPADWQAFRDQAHAALDTALDFVEQRPEQPVWQEMPPELKVLDQALPLEGEPLAKVLSEFESRVLPYTLGNNHPRFWGWVHGAGTANALISQMMIAALNANMGGRDHAPMYIERQLIRWMHELFEYPADEASGTLVTGTSSATLLGLSVARHRVSDGASRSLGNSDLGLVAYTSSESHVSVSKAMELLGLGSNALRSVPVLDDFSMDVPALGAMVEEDLAQGLTPFAVVSTVGTVNSGAIDDLQAINRLCAGRNIWHHVDGAFGALIMLSEQRKEKLKGISAADSIAFDFHKWMHVSYAAGCLLVRDGERHRQTFANSHAHSYLLSEKLGIAGGAPWPANYTIDLSRGFAALAVWFQLKEFGTQRLGLAIDRNCEQANWLSQAVDEDPALELMAPVSLNIVCYRYRLEGLDIAALNDLNRRIVVELQCRGLAAPSATEIAGNNVIRVCITNHRTRQDDLQALLLATRDIAGELLGSDV